MRIWKLFQKHYEQGVLHKTAKVSQMKIWKLFHKHHEKPFCTDQQQGVLHRAAKCNANEILENISKALQTNHFAQISNKLFA